jgi:DNA-binding CsgD family transcriptional regulator
MEFPPATPQMPLTLTAAERNIVGLLLLGSSNTAIACSRRTSVHTVANQTASIYRKLDVTSRSELYTSAARQG